MSETPDPRHPADLEGRLRAALAGRAGAVEPRGGTEAVVVERMAAARRAAVRRRAVLAAAVVLVVAAVAGALVLAGGDDATDVATGDTTTSAPPTATTGVPLPAGVPVLWPLPTMSVRYAEPVDAADSFLATYVGLTGVECLPTSNAGGIADLACGPPCPTGSDCADPAVSPRTTVRTRQDREAWVVVGADSSAFTVTAPAEGAVVGADIEVLVEGLDPAATATAQVPPLGADPAASPAVDTTSIPLGADGTWRLVLGAADGSTVLLVTDGTSATARAFTVDSAAVPPEATTTTTGPTDDGVQGWPGPVARSFEDPGSAARAFVAEVLGFADPTLVDLDEDGADAVAAFQARPTGGATTSITLHRTGTARGWVVTGVDTDRASIDSVQRRDGEVVVAGQAMAFEATVDVRVLDLAGNTLGEAVATTTDGASVAPFQVVVPLGIVPDGPIVVQVAEGDASGEGALNWAEWAPVPA